MTILYRSRGSPFQLHATTIAKHSHINATDENVFDRSDNRDTTTIDLLPQDRFALFASGLVPFGDWIVFSAFTRESISDNKTIVSFQQRLWQTDGTPEGTFPVPSASHLLVANNSDRIELRAVEFQNELYFMAHDGVHG